MILLISVVICLIDIRLPAQTFIELNSLAETQTDINSVLRQLGVDGVAWPSRMESNDSSVEAYGLSKTGVSNSGMESSNKTADDKEQVILKGLHWSHKNNVKKHQDVKHQKHTIYGINEKEFYKKLEKLQDNVLQFYEHITHIEEVLKKLKEEPIVFAQSPQLLRSMTTDPGVNNEKIVCQRRLRKLQEDISREVGEVLEATSSQLVRIHKKMFEGFDLESYVVSLLQPSIEAAFNKSLNGA